MTDFTATEAWTLKGLVTFYVLIVMELRTRRIGIAGVTTTPDSAWMTQVARNLTNPQDGFLKDATHLIMDRDTKFILLRTYLNEHAETEVVLLPPRSPNLNAQCERFMRSLKSECVGGTTTATPRETARREPRARLCIRDRSRCARVPNSTPSRRQQAAVTTTMPAKSAP